MMSRTFVENWNVEIIDLVCAKGHHQERLSLSRKLCAIFGGFYDSDMNTSRVMERITKLEFL